MIAMAVGDKYCREDFVWNNGFDPHSEVLSLVFGEGWINEDGFLIAMN
jgi:hypothetical protein